VVAAGLARRCEVQLAYAIGAARPVSMLVDTFGTGTIADERLSQAVARVFDARPGVLIEELKLRRPIYRQTAAYGHFGRTGKDFTWEQTPRIEELRAAAGARNGVQAKANGASAAGKRRRPFTRSEAKSAAP
jgi:S-adenosylmethionine synthetase